MTVALIMVTKDIYLKNGLLYFSSQDEEYKCFEFSTESLYMRPFSNIIMFI